MFAFLAPYRLYLEIGVAAAALTAFLFYRHSLVVDGEQIVEARVLQTTAEAEGRRATDLAKQHTADMATLKTIEDGYAHSLQVSNATTDRLNGQLRNYAAARSRGLAVPGDPASGAGPDVPAAQPGGVEGAVEGVVSAAGHDAEQVIALQQYIQKECH